MMSGNIGSLEKYKSEARELLLQNQSHHNSDNNQTNSSRQEHEELEPHISTRGKWHFLQKLK